jgi:hypothetical protein
MSSENVQSLIIDATKFNPVKQVKYSKMKVNKVGGKSVGIMNSETGKSLILQTPLILTWGANMFRDEKSGKVTYDMALQFPREEYQTEDNKKFLDAMVTFQKKLRQDAIANSKEWFNKTTMVEAAIDALFHPMLTYPKDKESGEPDMTKSPTLKVKIPFWENQFNCEIYDTNSEMLFPCESSSNTPLELIPKASNISALIQCGGIWFANGKFGVTWKLVQCVVKPKPSLKGRCLISLTSEVKTQIEKSAGGNSSHQALQVEDDDDAEDGEESASGGMLKVVEDSDDEEETPVVEQSQAPIAVEEVKAQVQATAVPSTPAPVKKEVKRIVKKKE